MAGLGKDDPLRILLTEIIDYAGLFPPAGLAMDKAVGNFAEYKRWPESWMLGRLVVPAAKLGEIPAALAASSNSSKLWQISALVPGHEPDPAAQSQAVQSIVKFNAESHGPGVVDAIECKADSVESLGKSLDAMPMGIRVFWELPLNDQLEPLIKVLASLKKGANGSPSASGPGQHCAKIRTGGIQPEMIPSMDQVARFIHLCATHRVAFKATAGLHHPVRSEQALTYTPDSPRAVLHGFLNVFLAATAAWGRKAGIADIEAILLAGHQESFVLKSSELGVGEFEFTGEELARSRREFAVSFGSCSFAEPVDDLQNMDWLPVSARS